MSCKVYRRSLGICRCFVLYQSGSCPVFRYRCVWWRYKSVRSQRHSAVYRRYGGRQDSRQNLHRSESPLDLRGAAAPCLLLIGRLLQFALHHATLRSALLCRRRQQRRDATRNRRRRLSDVDRTPIRACRTVASRSRESRPSSGSRFRLESAPENSRDSCLVRRHRCHN